MLIPDIEMFPSETIKNEVNMNHDKEFCLTLLT